jgi:hypothetical protein
MIDKGDILPIHCKMIFRGLMSMTGLLLPWQGQHRKHCILCCCMFTCCCGKVFTCCCLATAAFLFCYSGFQLSYHSILEIVVFLDCPSSSILKEWNITETGSFLGLKGWGGTFYFSPLERVSLNHWLPLISHFRQYVHLGSGFVNRK